MYLVLQMSQGNIFEDKRDQVVPDYMERVTELSFFIHTVLVQFKLPLNCWAS